jgi:hypothetical protein
MSGGIIDDPVGGNEDTTVEDSILDDVEEQTGESFDAAEESSDETPDEEDEPAARKPREDGPRERGERREVQSRIPTQRRVDYDYDRQGNVINPKDGSVIYPMGTPQRELFAQLQNERFHRSRVEGSVREMAQRGQSLEQAVEQMRRSATIGDQLGLPPKDQVIALEHMAQFRADPIKGVRRILNLYMQDGGDLSEIFDDLEKIQLQGLEQRLTSQVDKITEPQRQAEAEARRVNELTNRLNNEVASFFKVHPEAEQHADLLAHVINRGAEAGRSVSLNDAYVNILKFAHSHGLDHTRPLQEQLARGQVRQQSAIPRNTGVPRVQRSNSGKPLHDRSTRDLVREAMEEAGFET